MDFLERLQSLKQERGLNNHSLSTQTGIPYTTIDGWYKRGYDRVSLSTLQNLANFFNCSVDYLLGRSDDRIDDSVLDLINEIDNNLLEQYGNIRDALIAQAVRDKAITDTEFETIKKYRALDEHGTKIVDFVIDAEYERCMAGSKTSAKARAVRIIPYSNIPASAGPGEWLDDENMEEIEIPAKYKGADFAVPVTGDSMEPTYSDGDILLIHEQDAVNIGDIGLFAIGGSRFVKEMGNGVLVSHNKQYDNISIDEIFKCFGKVIGRL